MLQLNSLYMPIRNLEGERKEWVIYPGIVYHFSEVGWFFAQINLFRILVQTSFPIQILNGRKQICG